MFTESERVLQVESVATSAPTVASSIRQHYRLASVVDFITAQKAMRIALQFPDHLLVDTPMVVAELQSMLNAVNNEAQQQQNGVGAALSPYTLFVLSDNTFGACCPDEITAAHYTAQCIVHFGYACMSRTNRLPVMYVAERGEYDVTAISSMLSATHTANTEDDECNSAQIVVVLSQPARYLRPQIAEMIVALEKDRADAKALDIVIADRPTSSTSDAAEEDALKQWFIAGDAIPRLSSSASCCGGATACCQKFIFVGSADSPVLAQLAMICRFNDSIGKEGSSLQIVTPTTATETAAQKMMAANKALRMVDQRLMKRMYNIEMLKGCGAIGILVCTLAIKNYRESAEILSKLIRKSGRRCYIVYIGHVNEAKIANFSDTIDAFVVISCPHSRQAQFPQKDDNFMKPLCSPIEALIALGHAEFDDPQAYTTGFAECCAKAAEAAGLNTSDALSAPRITNSNAIAPADANAGEGEASTALLVRANHGGAVAQFSQRSYKGLEARLGETAVQTEVVQGLDGIAKGYGTEKETQNVTE